MNYRYFNKTFRPWLYSLVSNNMVADNDQPESPYYLNVDMLSDSEKKEFLGHIIEYHNFDADILNKECIQFFRDRLLNPTFICGDDNEFTSMMEEYSLNNYKKYMQELIDEIIPFVVQDRLKDDGLEYDCGGTDEELGHDWGCLG